MVATVAAVPVYANGSRRLYDFAERRQYSHPCSLSTALFTNINMTDSRRGLILINTGPGKGKTTAAMGTALRAVGNGMRVLMLQFLKGSWHYGELDAVKAFGENFVHPADGPRICEGGRRRTDPEDIRLVEAAWDEAREAINSGEWDLVILDEINYAISYKMLDPELVAEALRKRPGDGACDPDRPQRASAAGGAGRHGHRDARGEACVSEGHHGAARYRILMERPARKTDLAVT